MCGAKVDTIEDRKKMCLGFKVLLSRKGGMEVSLVQNSVATKTAICQKGGRKKGWDRLYSNPQV